MLSIARFAVAATLMMAPYAAAAAGQKGEDCGALFTTAEQRQCAEKQYRAATDELKSTYARVLKRAAKADVQRSTPERPGEVGASAALAASQQAWEIYRDAECRGVVGRGGGSGRMGWVLGCLVDKTRERVRELNVPYDQR